MDYRIVAVEVHDGLRAGHVGSDQVALDDGSITRPDVDPALIARDRIAGAGSRSAMATCPGAGCNSADMDFPIVLFQDAVMFASQEQQRRSRRTMEIALYPGTGGMTIAMPP